VRSRRGNAEEDRFVALTSAVGPDLLRYFARRTAGEAADLLAETLLVAWRRRDALPVADDNARMWLFGVARNVLANAARSGRRRQALADALRNELSSTTVTVPDVADALAIRGLVDALDPDLSEVITLAHWEGFSFAEIGRLQGVPAATVRGRYRRAKEALQSAVAHIDDAIPVPAVGREQQVRSNQKPRISG